VLEAGESLADLEASLCEDDYDSAQQRAMAGNLARREADRELIAALALEGFTGPAQEMLEAELAAYAYPVMMAWTRTGEIIRRCAQKGRPLGITDTGAGWSRDDRCELSTETVARALDFFRRKVLQAGAWDHTLGATIKTYFVGACLFQFPNVYQSWETERRNWQARCTAVVDDPEDPAGLRELPGTDDTEEQAIARRELQLVMAELEDSYPDLLQIVELRLCGRTDAEAAAELGLSARAVEGQWYRFRKEHRNRGERRSSW
jgi:DNA-directed RNA polymerase specialized sigma24 family protein